VSWIAAVVGSVCVGGALAGYVRTRRSTHVLVDGVWAVRARTTAASPSPSPRERLQRWWLSLTAASYVHGPWRRAITVSRVVLERKQPRRAVARFNDDFEIQLGARPRLLSQIRLQVQLSAVALVAILGALVVGKDRQKALPPHEAYAAGEPCGVGVSATRFFVSLATPSAHPFQTGAAGVNLATSSPAHSNVAFAGHTNTFITHSNTPHHQNTVISHTNTDLRPNPGPF
jgi:hypothetical protein